MRVSVTTHLNDGDEVGADYYSADTRVTVAGTRATMPETIHVRIGDALDLLGAPNVVLRTLREALVAACEAAGMDYVITDVGDEA